MQNNMNNIRTPAKSSSFIAMSPPPTPGRNHTYVAEVPTFFPVSQSILGAEHEPSRQEASALTFLNDRRVLSINISRRKSEGCPQTVTTSGKRLISVSSEDIPKLPFDFVFANKPKKVARVVSTASNHNNPIKVEHKNAIEDTKSHVNMHNATTCPFAKSA